MVTLLFRLIPLATGLLLAGCAVVSSPPPEIPPPPASSNPAVLSLLVQADTQTAAGQLSSASASLERALRIEPRNPALWQALARVRLEEGKYQQAENLAAKSNTLAGDHRHLWTENWRVIGQARSHQGDYQGAKEAFDRAEGGLRGIQ
jgi:predicted Zn-dependent protease